MTTTVTDRQRRRCYEAEALLGRHLEHAASGARSVEVAGSVVTLPPEVRFGSLDAVQRYVDGVLASGWFARRYPAAAVAPVRIRRRRGDRAAHYDAPGTIAVHEPQRGTGWALRELVVLHELAHHVVANEPELGVGEAAHGPTWAGVLEHLVAEALGPELGFLLQVTYADLGVAWRPVAAAGARR